MNVSQLCSNPSPQLQHQELPLNDDNDSPPTLQQALKQCTQLCQSVWSLKLQHTTVSEKERDLMIDELLKSAKKVFQDIQITEKWLTTNKRSNETKDHPYGEEYEDDDGEDDFEDDNGEDQQTVNYNTSTSTVNKGHAEYELIRQARNLQSNEKTRSKYRRRNRRNMIGQKCHSCGTTETPEWRRGPDGARTLCNACGLHYSKLLKKGSIGVQTQNYLIAGINKPRSSQPQETGGNKLVNFPFVLMDSKYSSGQPQRSFYTHPNNTLPPLSMTPSNSNTTSTIPVHNPPSLPLITELDSDSHRNTNSNTSSLHIHHWNQNK